MVGLVRPLVETVRPSGRTGDCNVGRRPDGRSDDMGQLGPRGDTRPDAVGLMLGVGVGRTDRTITDRHGEPVVVGRRRVGVPTVIVTVIAPPTRGRGPWVVDLDRHHMVSLVVRPPRDRRRDDQETGPCSQQLAEHGVRHELVQGTAAYPDRPPPTNPLWTRPDSAACLASMKGPRILRWVSIRGGHPDLTAPAGGCRLQQTPDPPSRPSAGGRRDR